MFGDGKTPVRLYFCNGITHIAKAGHFLKKRVVAAAGLSATLNNVACSKRTGQRIKVVALPVKLPGGRANDNGCIGDTRTNHNICTTIQRFLDAPGTQIGIGRKHFVAGTG